MIRRYADLAVGVVAIVLTAAIVFGSDVREGPVWVNALAIVAFGATLALRPRAPVAAAYGFASLLFVFSLLLTPPPRSPPS